MSFDGWIPLSDPKISRDLNQFNQGFRSLAQAGILLGPMYSFLLDLATAPGVISIYELRLEAKPVSYKGQYWQFGYVVSLYTDNSFVILQPNFEMEEGSFEVLIKDPGDEDHISLLMQIFIGLVTQRYHSLSLRVLKPQTKER